MKPYDLEVAAYTAAHKIFNGLQPPDRATPGGYRSAMIDEIADAIKAVFSAHVNEECQSVTKEQLLAERLLLRARGFPNEANAE